MNDGAPTLRIAQLNMVYPEPGRPGRRVLSGLDLQIDAGESVALLGRSGSGKSTLLHLAAGIAVPSSGRVEVQGQDLGALDEAGRTSLRRRRIGLIFQFFHLLTHLDVFENVALPGWIAGRGGTDLRDRVTSLLELVGLADRAHDPVGRLSGGEMQRVALCRAMLNRPVLLLADEPTGSLDDATGRQVMELLLEMSARDGCALLYVTHSRELARSADRTLELRDANLHPGPEASA